MPVINGMKMACEPCIRGHRSTKCTHANERLMVPVKKPGRPLSVCPHIHNQLCGCSGVTAAIPRKQKCHCGTSTETHSAAQSKPVTSAMADLPSPTKASFRVQKIPTSSKPHSRKQSYDPSNFGRINPNHINLIPFQQTALQQILAPAMQNGATSTLIQAYHTNSFQNPELPNIALQHQYGSAPHSANNVDARSTAVDNTSAMPSGSLLQYDSHDAGFGGSDSSSTPASCCELKSESIPHAPDINLFPQAEKDPVSGCCASKETMSGSSAIHQDPFSSTINMNQFLYNYYDPQTTVFAYPPSYGSYQRPLQPSEWRKSVMSNMYGQPSIDSQITNGITLTSSPATIANLDTFHTCSCGPGCQCIGCAAHPYNDATQDYVRSAYKMAHEASNAPIVNLTNGQKDANSIAFSPNIDNNFVQNNYNESNQNNGDGYSPPLAESPSDTGTGEEQNLSASDFFFVNYPFSNEGCGGDTSSCPCGDDCECIGCIIHHFNDPMSTLPIEPSVSGDTIAPINGNGGDSLNSATIKHESLSPGNDVQPVKSCCG